ncbi:hypothetical protein B0T20DRAFT_396269 [Sordaria brevicollis]|uniref:Uncharacterized protein n=1 Tax=Sordaria brevicollis TaxID=83679 RepID=A0AAE0P3B6_SORBR|nr:hypothetical protein B0T20DRAFT_396269 [Sordaria brevicollis]
MSSRPPDDPFARRPSRDSNHHQRRDSGSRDYHREDRYSSRPSSSHAGTLPDKPPNSYDSHRRDRDRDRERDRDRQERPRDRERDRGLPDAPARGPTVNTQTASAGDRSRPDHGPNTPATASSPTTNSRNPADVELMRFLRALCDSLISYTTHKYDLTQSEKALERRQAEYNKCTTKMADFPSVPELQKKFLDRDTKRRIEHQNLVRADEDCIKRARDGLASCLLQLVKSGHLPATLLPQASTSSKEYDDKIAQLEDALSSQKSTTQAQIDALQEVTDGFKAKRLLDQQDIESRFKELEGRFGRQEREYENKLAKQKEDFAKQLQTELAKQRQDFEQKLAKQNRESPKHNTKLEEQINSMQADMRKFKEAQEHELKTQLAKQQKKYEKQLEQQLEKQRATTQDASKQSSATELASLRQELSDLRTHLGTREQELDQVRTQVAQFQAREQEFSQMRAEVAQFQQKLEKQEEKLENLDLPMLDEACEIASFGFPQLRDRLPGLETRIADLETKTPLDVLGLTQQVADLGKKETNVSGFTQQVATLEAKMAQVSAAQKDSKRKMEEFQLKFADTFGKLVDNERIRINKLASEVKSLKSGSAAGTPTPQAGASTTNLEPLRAEFKQAKAEQQATLEELQKQLTAQDFAINNLNQRFNNITTKHVADIVIQHLIPETEKWKQDIEHIDERLESLVKDHDALKLNVSLLEVKTAGLTIEPNAQTGLKRRRTELENGHTERPVSSNGQQINAAS